MKKLILGQLIDVMPERLLLAEKHKLGFQELLVLLLNGEISRRESSSTIRRMSRQGIRKGRGIFVEDGKNLPHFLG